MLLSFLAATFMLAAQPDTLQAVTVVADRGVVVSRTDTVSLKNTTDASVPLLQIPGLYVGDNGGLAGLKTVSLRGFGSAHTAIYLDGVRVGNVQSGQADLGMLPVDNLSSVVVDYAQNSVSFQTRKPVFATGRNVAGGARIMGGNYGTWQPYGRVDVKLSSKLSLSALGSGVVTKGQRDNSDLKQIRTGADLFGQTAGGEYQAKLYYSGAERGVPGSLDYPSATDRQKDRNFLAQGTWRQRFSELYELHLSAKGSYDKLEYLSSWGDSDYAQTELQLNSSHRFSLNENWTLSATADLQWDGLKGNVYEGKRTGTVLAAAASYRTGVLKADLALEYAGTWDKGASSWNSFSPSADIRWSVTPALDVVAFVRRSFRTPTFNELYYPGYGNTELKPETALLTDLGLDWNRRYDVLSLQLKLDGYFNHYTDKIASGPSPDNPAVWAPYNIGKVQTFGADVLAAVRCSAEGWNIGGSLRYGWMRATDKTPGSITNGQQIPYVARHSIVVGADLEKNGWSAAFALNLRSGRRDAAGDMPDWHRLDASLGKVFALNGDMKLGVQLNVQNLLATNYVLVTGYPMPGRYLMAGLNFVF